MKTAMISLENAEPYFKFLDYSFYICWILAYNTRGRGRRMQTKTMAALRNLDFAFENSTVRVIANRSLPEITLAGLSIGPFEEGNEYEVYYWVAKELEKSGAVHFREDDRLDSAKLFKIQWKERAQTAGQISKLSDDFYPRLRRYLAELQEGSVKAPEKMREYETFRSLAHDIVNSRLRKVVALASAPTQSEQITKNFTNEEKFLYNQLSGLIRTWRTRILKCDGDDE